jgi:hypothetical protein
MATASNAEKSTFLALNRLPVPHNRRWPASVPDFAISKRSGLGTREKRDRLSGRPCPISTGMSKRDTFEQRHRADLEKTNSCASTQGAIPILGPSRIVKCCSASCCGWEGSASPHNSRKSPVNSRRGYFWGYFCRCDFISIYFAMVYQSI